MSGFRLLYDAEKGGAKLLRLGRPLNAASAHVDAAWSDGHADDALLHRLFQARLVSMHMGSGNALARLVKQFCPTDETEATHADVAHAADAGTTTHADGTMTLVEPERMSAVGKTWEECANNAKDMMLVLFNTERGTSYGKDTY